MNAIYVLVIGFVVAILRLSRLRQIHGFKVIQADPNRMTPAKMYMDGVEFMPTSRNILYGHELESISGGWANHWTDNCYSMGLVTCNGVDSGRNIFYWLGP